MRVSERGSSLVLASGSDVRGSVGEDGGARTGRSDTAFPQSQASKSSSCRGSGTTPSLSSPAPAFDL